MEKLTIRTFASLRRILTLSICLGMLFSFPAMADGWEKDAKGWSYKYYFYSDGPGTRGEYYKSGIFKIDGESYAFNDNGYMVVGWYWESYYEEWHYFEPDGRMRYEPLTTEQGITYYFSADDGACLNPNGEAVSAYELRLLELVSIYSELDIELPVLGLQQKVDWANIKTIIHNGDNFVYEFSHLPAEVPQKMKLQHAYISDYVSKYSKSLELLKQIMAHVESANTDYKKLIELTTQYNKALNDLDRVSDEETYAGVDMIE